MLFTGLGALRRAAADVVEGVVGLAVAVVVFDGGAVAGRGEHGADAVAPGAIGAGARAEQADAFLRRRAAGFGRALGAGGAGVGAAGALGAKLPIVDRAGYVADGHHLLGGGGAG